jgi:hypothetical protein
MVADRKARIVATTIVVATLLSSAYLVIAGLVDPAGLLPGAGSSAARVLGSYSAVRSLVLIAACAVLLAGRAWTLLGVATALQMLTQSGDTVVGIAYHRPVAEILGPACFAVALGFACWLLLRRPLSVGSRHG